MIQIEKRREKELSSSEQTLTVSVHFNINMPIKVWQRDVWEAMSSGRIFSTNLLPIQKLQEASKFMPVKSSQICSYFTSGIKSYQNIISIIILIDSIEHWVLQYVSVMVCFQDNQDANNSLPCQWFVHKLRSQLNKKIDDIQGLLDIFFSFLLIDDKQEIL